jgi:hypothetical protein
VSPTYGTDQSGRESTPVDCGSFAEALGPLANVAVLCSSPWNWFGCTALDGAALCVPTRVPEAGLTAYEDFAGAESVPVGAAIGGWVW